MTSRTSHHHLKPAAIQRFVMALRRYAEALDDLQHSPNDLLAVLLARDAVYQSLTQGAALAPNHIRSLQECDALLETNAIDLPKQPIAEWRRSFAINPDHWWWNLDHARIATQSKTEAALQEALKQRDSTYKALAVAALALATPFAAEFCRRFFAGGPDQTAFLITTLVTVLLGAAAGSLTDTLGRLVAPLCIRLHNLLRRLLRRPPTAQPVAIGAAALMFACCTLIVVLLLSLSMPALAVYFNNRGDAALRARDLAAGQAQLLRAVALNPDLVVPYQNLGDAYLEAGQVAEAQRWYARAIDADAGFAPAYRALAYVLNLQEQFKNAEQTSYAGLNRVDPADPSLAALVSRYGLLAELGHAYAEQKRDLEALATLSDTLKLEPQLREFELAEQQQTGATTIYRSALPHIYIAEVYERLNWRHDAACAWQQSLHFLKADDWRNKVWIATANSHQRIVGSCTQ